MTSLKDIKNFSGILNMPPGSKAQAVRRGVVGIVFGILLMSVSGWILFVKLQFFVAPKLALYFPAAYALLFGIFAMGLFVGIKGVIMLGKK